MKQRFQILNDPRFRLVYNENQQFKDGPSPSVVRLNRQGFDLLPGIKKKTVVYPYMPLAVHPSQEKGDLFSPIFGIITEVNTRSICIKAQEPEEVTPKVEPIELLKSDLKGEALILKLKSMGLNTRSLAKDCEILIINGLNPDPGIIWAEPMLTTHTHNLQAGLELHKRISKAKKIILAIPHGSKFSTEGIEVAYIEPEYPNSVDDLIIKEVTGRERPDNVGIVSLHNIWSLGRIAMTGLPLIETVLTISNATYQGNYIAKEGTLVGELLSFAKIILNDGDTVVRGGPLRGESMDNTDRSVTKGTHGLFVVEAGTVPPMKGHSPCINCGACVMVCPARISPSTLSKYAEFALHDRCRKENIFSCLDCGLCGYVCIARRPVLQYIRLAKQKLLEADALNALTKLPLDGGE